MGYGFIDEGPDYINESIYVAQLAQELTAYTLILDQALN